MNKKKWFELGNIRLHMIEKEIIKYEKGLLGFSSWASWTINAAFSQCLNEMADTRWFNYEYITIKEHHLRVTTWLLYHQGASLYHRPSPCTMFGELHCTIVRGFSIPMSEASHTIVWGLHCSDVRGPQDTIVRLYYTFLRGLHYTIWGLLKHYHHGASLTATEGRQQFYKLP